LDMGHTLRGEPSWEKEGKGRKPKTWSGWCTHCIGVNIVILHWESLWEGEQEVVKRSGRYEPMWVVIPMCMEAMLGISLYIYLKLAKRLCLIVSHIFSSTKLENKRA
jgi:hypothetical protein